jgi:hypothetical protein
VLVVNVLVVNVLVVNVTLLVANVLVVNVTLLVANVLVVNVLVVPVLVVNVTVLVANVLVLTGMVRAMRVPAIVFGDVDARDGRHRGQGRRGCARPVRSAHHRQDGELALVRGSGQRRRHHRDRRGCQAAQPGLRFRLCRCAECRRSGRRRRSAGRTSGDAVVVGAVIGVGQPYPGRQRALHNGGQ